MRKFTMKQALIRTPVKLLAYLMIFSLIMSIAPGKGQNVVYASEKITVTITSEGSVHEYDGTRHYSNGRYKVDWSDGNPGNAEISGIEVAIVDRMAPGEVMIPFWGTDIEIIQDGVDVTENYIIERKYEFLEIVKREGNDRIKIPVAANSGVFVYDGNEKSVEGYEYITLPENKNDDEEDKVYFDVSGIRVPAVSKTDPGVYDVKVEGSVKAHVLEENPIRPVIFEMRYRPKIEVDVSENYVIDPIDGVLVIRSSEDDEGVVLTAASATKQYDGTALTADSFSHSGYPEWVTSITATVEGSQTEIGSSDNIITGYNLWVKLVDVTGYYENVTTENGLLTVTAPNEAERPFIPGGPGGTPASPTTPAAPAKVPEEKPPEKIIEEENVPLTFISDHIQFLCGYPDGSVRPDNGITRAEAAQIFHRLLANTDKHDFAATTLSDVSVGAWYYQAVAYLNKHGIVTGYPDGTFRPDISITRAEYAKMASEFDNLDTSLTNVFDDVSDGHWAVSYINSAAAKGWVAGFSDGTFKPEEDITRAQVVTIVNRMLKRAIAANDIPAGVVKYIDLTTGHWAYCDIIEASHTHEYDLNENGTELWTWFSK